MKVSEYIYMVECARVKSKGRISRDSSVTAIPFRVFKGTDIRTDKHKIDKNDIDI